MLNRRTLLKSGALAIGGAAAIDLQALAGPVARTHPPGLLELDRNENPYGPPQSAKRAVGEAMERGNRYLDGHELDAFRDQIAVREGVKRESVVLGAGSSEILWMAAVEFLGPGDVLLLGDPTFELIGRCAGLRGATVERVPVTAGQADDLDALTRRLSSRPKLVYLCHPNNPCGTMLATAEVRRFVLAAARQAPVLVDEAYLDYPDPELKGSMAELVRGGQNVIVARTFSKIYGLAGMRMGYAIAAPETARRLARHRFSVLNSLAVASASAALRDKNFVDLARKRNEEGRAIITAAFEKAGIRYAPSVTSFLWFDESRQPDLSARLRAQNILIPGGRFGGGWNRVTIGTIDETKRFAEALLSSRA
ncbi:MAG TPA: histidinol-phosphate transaminase [Thermoanaerobaculia bacterium]|nr:histidinol-phosphate transaminase [Thermoanaerobaculia bacterium]